MISSGSVEQAIACSGVMRPSAPAGQRLAHRLHPAFRPGLHGGVDLVGLLLPDQITDGRGHEHDLQREHQPPAVGAETLLSRLMMASRSRCSRSTSLWTRTLP